MPLNCHSHILKRSCRTIGYKIDETIELFILLQRKKIILAWPICVSMTLSCICEHIYLMFIVHLLYHCIQ